MNRRLNKNLLKLCLKLQKGLKDNVLYASLQILLSSKEYNSANSKKHMRTMIPFFCVRKSFLRDTKNRVVSNKIVPGSSNNIKHFY